MPSSWQYPSSRTKGKQCQLCERGQTFGNNSWIEMNDSDGRKVKYLKQTCSYCGHVLFFDIEYARRVEYDNSSVDFETFPEEK